MKLFGDSEIDQLVLVFVDEFLLLVAQLLNTARRIYFYLLFITSRGCIVIFIVFRLFGLGSRSLLHCPIGMGLVDEGTELLLIDFGDGCRDEVGAG